MHRETCRLGYGDKSQLCQRGWVGMSREKGGEGRGKEAHCKCGVSFYLWSNHTSKPPLSTITHSSVALLGGHK